MSRPTESEIVIEIDQEYRFQPKDRIPDPFKPKERITPPIVSSGNGHVIFPPYECEDNGIAGLRSRIVFKRWGRGATDAHFRLLQLDGIPGQRVHFDREARIGRITDALGDPENEALFDQLRDIKDNDLSGVNVFSFWEAIPDVVVKLDTDEACWTWQYWMVRLLQKGPAMKDGLPSQTLAREVQNCHLLPTLQECIESRLVRFPVQDSRVSESLYKELEKKQVPFDGHLIPEIMPKPRPLAKV